MQWALLLAAAALAGQLLQRLLGVPAILGYSAVGALAGLGGFAASAWPLSGLGRFLLELGLSVVLFEAGSRVSLRWFRHNPMVLVQSVLEAGLSFWAVRTLLTWLAVPDAVALPLALIGLAASPAVLSRVALDLHASGPVTERSRTLATLNTLYALTIGGALAGLGTGVESAVMLPSFSTLQPVLVVLGLSFVAAALMALAMRLVLLLPAGSVEHTAIVLLALLAAFTTLGAHLGGSAPLAGLLGGLLLKQIDPRPWRWPSTLQTLASPLVLLMFVLVAALAAQGDWSPALWASVAAVLAARLLVKALGLLLGSIGGAMRPTQALWTTAALSPMSAVALVLTSQFASARPAQAADIAALALPAILVMELLGALLAAHALRRAGECPPPAGLGGGPPAPTSPEKGGRDGA
ncbi:MAG: hypothetical protein Fur0019_03880 [Tibeticola sp.]